MSVESNRQPVEADPLAGINWAATWLHRQAQVERLRQRGVKGRKRRNAKRKRRVD